MKLPSVSAKVVIGTKISAYFSIAGVINDEKKILDLDDFNDSIADILFQKSFSGSRLKKMYDDRRFSIILYASKPGVLFFLPTTFL